MIFDWATSLFSCVSRRLAPCLFTVGVASSFIGIAGCYQDSLPTPQGTVQILTILLNDRDASVRRTAADALGKIGDLSVEPFLVRTLHDPDSAVREAAARSFGRLSSFGMDGGRALVSLLRDPDLSVRRAAAQALGGADENPTLASSLANLLASSDATVRQAAAHALLLVGARDASVSEALSKGTTDADPVVRQWAVAALAESGDSHAIPVLMDRLLRDPAEAVRVEAAYRLRFIGDGSVATALDTVVQRNESADIKRWVENSRTTLRKGSDSDSGPRPIPPAETGPSHQYP